MILLRTSLLLKASVVVACSLHEVVTLVQVYRQDDNKFLGELHRCCFVFAIEQSERVEDRLVVYRPIPRGEILDALVHIRDLHR